MRQSIDQSIRRSIDSGPSFLRGGSCWLVLAGAGLLDVVVLPACGGPADSLSRCNLSLFKMETSSAGLGWVLVVSDAGGYEVLVALS